MHVQAAGGLVLLTATPLALGTANSPLGEAYRRVWEQELPGRAGWAVPMATDIAFVVGGPALLGPRVPACLKIFLLSLAIIDDILTVLVIAIFFTTAIEALWLAAAAAGFGLTGLLNHLGVRRVAVYVLVGLGIWLCTLESGVHPTVSGALLGLLTPASAWLGSATCSTWSIAPSSACATRIPAAAPMRGGVRRPRISPSRRPSRYPRSSAWSVGSARGSASRSCPCSRSRTRGSR